MRSLVRMHGKRAKQTLELYTPTLFDIDKENAEQEFRMSRGQIHKLLHYLLIMSAFVPIALYILSLL